MNNANDDALVDANSVPARQNESRASQNVDVNVTTVESNSSSGEDSLPFNRPPDQAPTSPTGDARPTNEEGKRQEEDDAATNPTVNATSIVTGTFDSRTVDANSPSRFSTEQHRSVLQNATNCLQRRNAQEENNRILSQTSTLTNDETSNSNRSFPNVPNSPSMNISPRTSPIQDVESMIVTDDQDRAPLIEDQHVRSANDLARRLNELADISTRLNISATNIGSHITEEVRRSDDAEAFKSTFAVILALGPSSEDEALNRRANDMVSIISTLLGERTLHCLVHQSALPQIKHRS